MLTGSKSVKLAESLRLDEAVAGKGVVKSFDENGSGLIVLDPAVLTHKDRVAPKREKELLNEVDPNAN